MKHFATNNINTFYNVFCRSRALGGEVFWYERNGIYFITTKKLEHENARSKSN
jgi:hypothetical protein